MNRTSRAIDQSQQEWPAESNFEDDSLEIEEHEETEEDLEGEATVIEVRPHHDTRSVLS